MDLDELAGPGPAVEHVDVLGDDRVQEPAALELDQRAVRPVGLLALERLEAVAVEVPEARGVLRQASMWATSIGSTFSHSPVPGERKSGIPEAPRCRRR